MDAKLLGMRSPTGDPYGAGAGVGGCCVFLTMGGRCVGGPRYQVDVRGGEGDIPRRRAGDLSPALEGPYV